MSLEFRNITFLKAFVRNLSDIGDTSKAAASRLADEMESIVRNRTAQGNYIGGVWESKPYSRNPIKAYKLGRAVVSSVGMGRKELTIDGKSIPKDDWAWGDWDKEQEGIPNISGRMQGPDHSRPLPIYIPGYAGWRKMNSRSMTVNMRFSKEMSMLDSFSVSMWQGRGSNQYGQNWRFSFEMQGSRNIRASKWSNVFRKWQGITERELDKAIKESGASISSMLFRGT